MENSLTIAIGAALAGFVAALLISMLVNQRSRLRLENQLELQAAQLEQSLSERAELRAEKELMQKVQQEQQIELRNVHAHLAAAQEKAQQQALWHEECERLNQELRGLQSVNSVLEAELREMSTRLEETRFAAEEKQRLLINSEQRLTVQFENLTNRIFEQSGRKVDEQNRQSLDRLLLPLSEQLEGFRRQVQENYGQESRERHTLTHEIRHLQQLNAQMAQEALNLTKALKGDNKTQGNWGR